MDLILHKAEQTLSKLSADPETKREYEQSAKELSDERSRLEYAKEAGVLEVAKSLLDSGMPLHKIAKHTPYSVEEIESMLSKYNLL